MRPRRNNSAVAPFTAIPTAATQITVLSSTGSGVSSRRTASTPMAPVPISRMVAFSNAAKIELRPQP